MKKINRIQNQDDFLLLEREYVFPKFGNHMKLPKLTKQNLQIIVNKINELTEIVNKLVDEHNAPITGGHDVDEFYKD